MPLPPHTKKYSFKENEEFLFKIWGSVCQKHVEFNDLAADDHLSFYRKFAVLSDKDSYFESNKQQKRFREIQQTEFRKRLYAEALKKKKAGE